ncbi:uncharacterized protein LOC134208807 [Armigeres subalbatus]|uniref:uncharacterized protein LOC134208807 n=1 Tax=Armigeres subalbatus TaxID=124917 RepID=UPI002ED2EA8B
MYKILAICDVEKQKVWKSGHRAATFYQSCATTNELGTGFIVLASSTCTAHEGRRDDEEEAFYAQLEKIYDGCPRRDVKIVIGDMNAQVGREEMYRLVIEPDSLHTASNDNGQRCINFAAPRGSAKHLLSPQKFPQGHMEIT